VGCVEAAVGLAKCHLDTVAGLGQRGEFLPQTHLHAGVAVQRLAQQRQTRTGQRSGVSSRLPSVSALLDAVPVVVLVGRRKHHLVLRLPSHLSRSSDSARPHPRARRHRHHQQKPARLATLLRRSNRLVTGAHIEPPAHTRGVAYPDEIGHGIRIASACCKVFNADAHHRFGSASHRRAIPASCNPCAGCQA
jgi:hypothetical protein